jgi:hypothetical protein
MPDDLYNGMALVLLKNLPGGAGATVHMAVFMPKPRPIEMEWRWEGEDEVMLGGRPLKTMRSLVKQKRFPQYMEVPPNIEAKPIGSPFFMPLSHPSDLPLLQDDTLV